MSVIKQRSISGCIVIDVGVEILSSVCSLSNVTLRYISHLYEKEKYHHEEGQRNR
jgi:hypothetical protein